ncbi:hypothetical protein K2173_001990 [Erythroxylum novogranatense]|uniref:Transmembrane protein n=1 Tax=Erythroxylum novogranatense TaxID=1862640 RepID=A0AAV8SP81_9ROSI|nr:hypothetical protein K2173_001990 [Erythroxylum novogranatense]
MEWSRKREEKGQDCGYSCGFVITCTFFFLLLIFFLGEECKKKREQNKENKIRSFLFFFPAAIRSSSVSTLLFENLQPCACSRVLITSSNTVALFLSLLLVAQAQRRSLKFETSSKGALP